MADGDDSTRSILSGDRGWGLRAARTLQSAGRGHSAALPAGSEDGHSVAYDEQGTHAFADSPDDRIDESRALLRPWVAGNAIPAFTPDLWKPSLNPIQLELSRAVAIRYCWVDNDKLLVRLLESLGPKAAHMLNLSLGIESGADGYPVLCFALAFGAPRCVQACLDFGADAAAAAACFYRGVGSALPLGGVLELEPVFKRAVASSVAECLVCIEAAQLGVTTAAAKLAAGSTSAAAKPAAGPATQPLSLVHAIAQADLPKAPLLGSMLAADMPLSAARYDSATLAQLILHSGSRDDAAHLLAETLLAAGKGTSSLDLLIAGACPGRIPTLDTELTGYQWATDALLPQEALAQLHVPIPGGIVLPLAKLPGETAAIWLFQAAPGAGCPDSPFAGAAAALASSAAARFRLTAAPGYVCERDGCHLRGNILTARAWKAGWDGSKAVVQHLVHLHPDDGAAAGSSVAESAGAPPAAAPGSYGHVLAVFLQLPSDSSNRRAATLVDAPSSSRELYVPRGTVSAPTLAAGRVGPYGNDPLTRAAAFRKFWLLAFLPQYSAFELVMHVRNCTCAAAQKIRGAVGATTDGRRMVLCLQKGQVPESDPLPPPAPVWVSEPYTEHTAPAEASLAGSLYDAWTSFAPAGERPPLRLLACPRAPASRPAAVLLGSAAAAQRAAEILNVRQGTRYGVGARRHVAVSLRDAVQLRMQHGTSAAAADSSADGKVALDGALEVAFGSVARSMGVRASASGGGKGLQLGLSHPAQRFVDTLVNNASTLLSLCATARRRMEEAAAAAVARKAAAAAAAALEASAAAPPSPPAAAAASAGSRAAGSHAVSPPSLLTGDSVAASPPTTAASASADARHDGKSATLDDLHVVVRLRIAFNGALMLELPVAARIFGEPVEAAAIAEVQRLAHAAGDRIRIPLDVPGWAHSPSTATSCLPGTFTLDIFGCRLLPDALPLSTTVADHHHSS